MTEEKETKMNQTDTIKVLGRVLSSTGKVHQNQEVYDIRFIAPTCKATHYKDPIKVLVSEEKNDSNR